MVEMHFWMLGVFFEPQYSYAWTMLTKLITLVSVFDDFYDNYSTTEESKMFTTALERLLLASLFISILLCCLQLLCLRTLNLTPCSNVYTLCLKLQLGRACSWASPSLHEAFLQECNYLHKWYWRGSETSEKKHAELVKKLVNYVSLPDLICLIIPILEYIYKSPN